MHTDARGATTNVVTVEFDRLSRIGTEIKAVLDAYHRELQRLGQDGAPLDWRNGNSPHDDELRALQERYGVDYDVVWNEDGRTVKAVRVRYRPRVDADKREIYTALNGLMAACGLSGESGAETLFNVLFEAIHGVDEGIIEESHAEGLGYDVNTLLAERIEIALREVTEVA